MSRGLALLVGLTEVDPTPYRDFAPPYTNWDGKDGCWGCELDVDNMVGILAPLGFSVTTLKTSGATRRAILDKLNHDAKSLIPGDLLVFYYSGHGSDRPDRSGDENVNRQDAEQDQKDETLVVYDGRISDDELDATWRVIKRGVRIVMISDSCRSGTNYRVIRGRGQTLPSRLLTAMRRLAPMKASLIHMGACRDENVAIGGREGSLFTIELMNVLNNPQFHGGYRGLLEEVANRVVGRQSPQYNEYGHVSKNFREQRPFTI